MAYFANSTDGATLDNQCAECLLGEAACPILMQSLMYNYDQCEEGQENLKNCLNMGVNERGECLMKKVIDEALETDNGYNV